MNHPHIVLFLGAFMQSGAKPALCILLEFAAGGPLDEDIQRERKMGRSYDTDVVISWMTQLATAVSYMHGRNVLHRDLSSGASLLELAQPHGSNVSRCGNESARPKPPPRGPVLYQELHSFFDLPPRRSFMSCAVT